MCEGKEEKDGKKVLDKVGVEKKEKKEKERD